ncbi:uncharacterized protein LOC112591695 [Melanaphis sacchari]|uniref:uncharacterized protein LOC112591695 n=1 Tax=Melanaphis sacchari TaxID=742174 RepID=UPI000DC13051|nr:uncharacterized protein LOC112591695 [Melanaphis sacchari]
MGAKLPTTSIFNLETDYNPNNLAKFIPLFKVVSVYTMASNGKYLNISIQPQKIPRTSKPLFELPKENLSETELNAKSTSDRTKRRIAHKPRFPLPNITKPLPPVRGIVAQPKSKIKNMYKKESFSRIQPCKVRQINETFGLDSRATHCNLISTGFNNRIKDNKRKSEDLDYGVVIKKKQKKINDKSKNKGVKQEKKSR